MTDATPLLPLVRKYFERDTEGAAHSLETMDEEEAVQVLTSLPPHLAAAAVRRLQVGYTAALLRNADPELFRSIVPSLEPQLAASIIVRLPEEKQQQMLGFLPERLKRSIAEALTYPEDSIGRIMGTDFLAFHQETTVGDAVEKIRSLARKRYPASYAYVIDGEERLVGVMNMRDLMLARAEDSLQEVMRRDIFALHSFLDRDRAAEELAKRRYFAAPVVDGQNRLLGIIRAEQLLQGLRDEMSRDVQQMFGAGRDEKTFSPLSFSMRKRLPWLHVNLATAFLAAGVVALFEDIIARLTILAVFLPVVAGQGGNAGAQSLAVVMRGLVMREIPSSSVRKLILKEGTLGAINGAIIGVVTAGVAWVWNGNPFLGLVIGLGMLFNLFFAGLSGASIPIGMKAAGLDPAQCSSIILTTVTDVMGFFAFLGFAVLFQAFLL